MDSKPNRLLMTKLLRLFRVGVMISLLSFRFLPVLLKLPLSPKAVRRLWLLNLRVVKIRGRR